MNTEKEQHDGSILERELRESTLSVSDVARKLGSNRKTLYNWYAKPELPASTAAKVGAIIGVDLIAKYPNQFTGERPYQANVGERIKNLNESDINYWKNKCLELQGKLIACMEAK